jgi:hypothetical protein
VICWPKHWLEAAMKAGFAHYQGDSGAFVFLNDKMRDMLAVFADGIERGAELAAIEEWNKLAPTGEKP